MRQLTDFLFGLSTTPVRRGPRQALTLLRRRCRRHGVGTVLTGMCLVVGAACAQPAAGTAPPSDPTSTTAVTAETGNRSSEKTIVDSADAALAAPTESTDVATAADATSETSAAFAPKKVAVVGDSLTVATKPLIANAIRLQGATSVQVDAAEGRRMTGRGEGQVAGIDAVAEFIDSGFVADLWVIELGTNDIGSEVHPESFRADMESILKLVPEGTPVVWVNVHHGHFADATDEANAIISSVAASRPNTWVADWHSMAKEDPDLLTDDGVHLRDRGEVAYSLAISIAVAEAGTP